MSNSCSQSCNDSAWDELIQTYIDQESRAAAAGAFERIHVIADNLRGKALHLEKQSD